jgi:glycosyltransferase involved in cell wall biosynthesis
LNLSLPPIIHIVRRFGPVGGMEGYVWNLTHELTNLGLSIEVICEETLEAPHGDIIIHKVARSESRPRWKSMLRFRGLVTELITQRINEAPALIHSHERSEGHHLTTFHGPPMVAREILWGLPPLNRRVNAWKQMERDELINESVKQVLAVSSRIRDQLVELHPELQSKKIEIAYPGIKPQDGTVIPTTSRSCNTNRFVFVGREWKRKGLELAVKIIEKLPKGCVLDVYGPTKKELPRRITEHPSVEIKGWAADIPWIDYEVLIHPARNEPFGMVIPEARSFGVKVLTTDIVGSTEFGFNDLIALSLDSPLSSWITALIELTNQQTKRIPECLWSWTDLARQHAEIIYPNTYRTIFEES